MISFGAESYLVVDEGSGRILAAKNENSPRQVASLTKVATVMVVLEWLDANGGDLEQLMPVSERSAGLGASAMTLKAGDSLPVRSGIFAAMMASDNVSAYTMAEFVGSMMAGGMEGEEAVEVFVKAMNSLAVRLGMSETRFVNPHGLDGETLHGVSTAADLARLSIHAYCHPRFPEFCRERERTVQFLRDGTQFEVRLINTNELVGSRGIDGIKTGTTWRAGECLVAISSKRISVAGMDEERRLFSVVLKSD